MIKIKQQTSPPLIHGFSDLQEYGIDLFHQNQKSKIINTIRKTKTYCGIALKRDIRYF